MRGEVEAVPYVTSYPQGVRYVVGGGYALWHPTHRVGGGCAPPTGSEGPCPM